MAHYLFDLVLLAPVLAIVVSEDISSFTTDVPPAIVLFVACSQAYRLLSTKCSELFTASSAVVLVILAVLAATMKASYIIMAGLLVLTAAVSLVQQASKPVIVRAGKWSVAIAVFGIVPWIINGILLSGYPLYPSTFGGLPVDWKVPEDLATAQRLWIAAHARHSIADGGLQSSPAGDGKLVDSRPEQAGPPASKERFSTSGWRNTTAFPALRGTHCAK
jgi:hypothetical protein